MYSQPSLPGIDAAPIPTDRLFFAIFPEMGAARRIAKLVRGFGLEHGLSGAFLAAERLHISLHHVGDFAGLPQGTLAMAGKAGSAAAAVTPAFEVEFDQVESFRGGPDNHPFVLSGNHGIIALSAFCKTLGGAMEKTGFKLLATSYKPHITLLYSDGHIARQQVAPITWTAREFVLVRSLLGRKQYIVLARWSLLS